VIQEPWGADGKYCGGCRQLLPLREFGRNCAKLDGLQAWCKGCMRAYRHAGRELERERERARRRAA